MMGEVDIRTRWRAAHALRRLVHLGDANILGELIKLWDRTSELGYRKSDAPFYWLSARLWLVIALDRIAVETPSAVGHHGLRVLEIATDDKFPHVLIRSFAKSAVYKLLESKNLVLKPAQRKALNAPMPALFAERKRSNGTSAASMNTNTNSAKIVALVSTSWILFPTGILVRSDLRRSWRGRVS